MVITQGTKVRVWLTHAFLIGFVAIILFPLLMVVSISFREGNFSRGDLIPRNFTLEHWTLAFGKTYVGMNNNGSMLDSGVGRPNLGIGRLEISTDGAWSLDVNSEIPAQYFPLRSYIRLLTIDAAANPVLQSNQVDFLLVDNDEQAANTAEGVQVVRLGDQLAGQLRLPEGFQGSGRPRLEFGSAYYTLPPFPVLTWLQNSIKISLITAFLLLSLSVTAAYAFARLRFKGKMHLLRSMLLLQMFPAVLGVIALYEMFDRLGFYLPAFGLDTHAAYILAMLAGVTMNIWIIMGYFSSIDSALEESAYIDGATPWQTFYKILLPLSVPILAVVFILAFITTINEFVLASVLLRSQDNLTLAVGSTYYFQPQNTLWGNYAAAAVLSGVPITVVFLIAQRFLVSGLTAGGVKG
ncbi:maltose ABC transporter permease MalG [Salinispirillum marinum]|uniref:Maltose/maltodextrin transport system permease protein MalG n=2 Tax=Saccharospirillaceae TaxID=255527 RepID=A0ABV8BAW7_9GAMM